MCQETIPSEIVCKKIRSAAFAAASHFKIGSKKLGGVEISSKTYGRKSC